MTQQQLPAIDAAYFDFDIARDANWPLPAPRAWNEPAPDATKPSLWGRWQDWLDDILIGDFGDE